MNKVYLIFLLAGVILFSQNSFLFAEEKSIELSLYSPYQLYEENTDVRGLRLSLLYGHNKKITGVDLGYGLNSVENLNGFQFGAVNFTKTATAVQTAVFWNVNEEEFDGFQGALLMNLNEGNFKGLQVGILNKTEGSFTGVQVGALNICSNLKGVQIGFLNIIRNTRWLPIINAGTEF